MLSFHLKGCTRLVAASDKAYPLLTHGRWFSLGTPASTTTKTGRHDIAEILLKVALKHQKSKSNQTFKCSRFLYFGERLSMYWGTDHVTTDANKNVNI